MKAHELLATLNTLGGKHLRQAREVRVARDEHVGPEASRAQTRFRAW